MSNTSSSSSAGIGFFGLLAIVFIVLKLCAVIDWDWLWVTAPLWGPVAVIVGVALVLVLFCLSMAALQWVVKKKGGSQ